MAIKQENEFGIDEEFISKLVDTFYGRIQEDKTIGPIFNRRINGEWQPHLLKMKDFWSSIILHTRKYSGRPMPMHRKIEELQPEHFKIWLSLFEQTLNDISPSKEVIAHFMTRANQIGNSLKAGVFNSNSK